MGLAQCGAVPGRQLRRAEGSQQGRDASLSFPRRRGLMPASTRMQGGGLQSVAEEKQVFNPCSSALRSSVMRAGWKRRSPSPPLEAGPCLAAARLFLEHLGPAFPREHVPSLAGTLRSRGIAQATPFIAEEWKIFPAQLPAGLVCGFPPVFPGCAP